MPISVAKVERRSRARAAAPTAVETPTVRPLAWPVEQWLRFQVDLFKATEPALIGWLDRRRAAVAAVLDSLGRLAACRDFGAAAAIHAAWLDGAMKRLALDMQAAAEHAQALSRCTAGAAERAAQTTTEIAEQGADWVVRRLAEANAPPPQGQTTAAATPAAEALWQIR